MFGVERYIDENYKDHLFSEMLYQQGVVSGANVDCAKNYGDFGAKCIIIRSIIISISAAVCRAAECPADATFTDVTGRVLFVLDVTEANNGIFELWKVIDGSQLFIRCNSTFVKFSLAHQYLTVREKRW